MSYAIGQPYNRASGSLKVRGKAPFAADHNIPGVVHAVMIDSAIAKGRIVLIDTRAAERVPGVLAVLTYNSKIKLAKNPMEVTPGSPADRALQLLQDDRVLYGNQPIGVAVAETLEAAREAAGMVNVRYDPKPPSVKLPPGIENSYEPEKAGGGQEPPESSRGDVGQGLNQGDARVEETYWTPFHTHSPLEPHATIAIWDGPDKLTLYDSSQGIFGDRTRVADLLGIKPENVRVLDYFVGGGFGSKGPTWSHTVLCAMAARQVNRPVKLVVRRPQMFGLVGCRSETRQSISAGAKRDGTLTALRNETLSHTSTFDEFTETATFPTRMLYSTPNNYTIQRLVRSDIGTPSYTRAPGEAPGTFALEVAMDELAYKLDMDPLELRLKNYAERDEDKDLPWSTKSLRECYRQGAERFGWSKRPGQLRARREGNTLIGWGMATAVYPARRSPASALARIDANGNVIVEAGSQEIGGGTYTVMAQVAADTLGAPYSQVTFRLGDTRYPETPVSGGSQTTASTGSAVMMAAQALRDKLFQLAIAAKPRPGAKPEDIAIEGEYLAWHGSAGKQSLRSLLAGKRFVEAEASSKPNGQAREYSMYSFGAQFAEVHVDADLGQTKVSRMAGTFAAGRILNAKTARSQFMGGMVWGVSMALYEIDEYDLRLGRIVNNNLAEYHVPVNADIGAIDVSWVDEDDRHVSPIGAKGIGEIGITGSAAAVANAIYHATGKRVRDLPITPDKLL